MTYDQWLEFARMAGVFLFMALLVAGVGLGAAMDVTALQPKKTRPAAIADLALTGGDGIATWFALRWWRRRKRRLKRAAQ